MDALLVIGTEGGRTREESDELLGAGDREES